MTSPTPTTSTASLADKSALVTGGGRGIGRAISLQLARKGVTKIAITYVGNKSAADDVAAQCMAMGTKKAITIHADILSPSIGPDLIASVLAGLEISTLDIVVNNAALLDMKLNEPFEKMTLAGFSKMMQGNVFAAMSIIGTALPYLPQRNGRVINISSISAASSPDPLMAYGASKAALEFYTRSLAESFASQKLATFNSVSVGATKTDAMEQAIASNNLPQSLVEKLTERPTAEKRLGEPDDVAMIVGWLASEESRWINGASVMANGGDINMLAAQG